MRIVFSAFFLISSLFANTNAKMPEDNYRLQVGLANDSKVSGVTAKDELNLPKSVQIPKKEVAITVKSSIDLSDAYMLQQIESYKSKSSQLPQVNLIALPDGYSKELLARNKQLEAERAGLASVSDGEKVEKLLFMRCNVAQDYKINTDTTIKMFCRDTKDPDLQYQLNASLAVNNHQLVSIPYMIEDDHGGINPVNKEKSRLYNAANGSLNIATFVDKRVFDKAEQGIANAFATQAPALAKDYIAQSNKANTELIQSNNGLNSTITQSTSNPPPEESEYITSLVVSMIGEGLKAGIDQLYVDIGYIFFIPKDTVIEAEIVVEVKK